MQHPPAKPIKVHLITFKKEFMLNAVNSLDDEKTYILAQNELEMFKEIGLE